MPGTIYPHNNIIAIGVETVTASLAGVTVPGLPNKINFVRAEYVDVDGAAKAALTGILTTKIAPDGKSFTIYSFTAAGAASSTARSVRWFAVIE
jgi:hypothetical protein